jgi:hypothetical protein
VQTSAAPRPAVRCPPRHADVVTSDARAAVYSFPHRGPDGYKEGSDVRACARGHRPVLLREIVAYEDNAGPCLHGCRVDSWRRTTSLAGSMVAYATDSGEDTKYRACYCERWGITVRDLRTGRLVRAVATGPHRGNVDAPGYPSESGPEKGDLYVGDGPAERVAVRPDGSVAWIAEDFIGWLEAFRSGRKESRSYELRVIDQAGERVLASGPGLDRRSLSLHGSRLEWTQDGARSYATLQ